MENTRFKSDVVVDADAIAVALGSPVAHNAQGAIWDAALAARSALIDFALSSEADFWIIDTAPSDKVLQKYKANNAELILIDPGMPECLSRSAERPKNTENAIKRWYENGTGDYLKKFGWRAVTPPTARGATPLKSVAGKGTIMKRAEISEIFPEATAEQVEAIMTLHGKGISDVEKLEKDLKAAREALATAKAGDKSKELKDAQEALATANAELSALKTANALRATREKVAAAKGIPVDLLTGETEESCVAQADAILAFAKPSDYPPAPDGGEPTNNSGDAWTAFSAQLSKN